MKITEQTKQQIRDTIARIHGPRSELINIAAQLDAINGTKGQSKRLARIIADLAALADTAKVQA